MKQFEIFFSGVTAPFLIAVASFADEIPLACLHGMKDMPTHPLPGLLRDAVSGILPMTLFARIQTLLGKKFDHIKQFLTTNGKAPFSGPRGLTRIARRVKESERQEEWDYFHPLALCY